MVNVRASVVVVAIGTMFALLVPIFANYASADTSSDAQCAAYPEVNPGASPCSLDQKTNKFNGYMCPCGQSDNGFATKGFCDATSKCKATSTGGKSPDSGLSQLGQILGQLLGKLGQSSGGSGSGSSPTTATGCQSSYYYTSNTSLIGVDPCALYQPSTTCTDPNASNYQAQATCVYNTSLTSSSSSSSAQDLLNELTGSSGSSSSGSTSSATPTLSAAPTSGAAPLAIVFTTNQISGSENYIIDPGDGSGGQGATSDCASAGASACVYGLTYTYSTAGTYTALLEDSSGDQLSTVTVSVTNPNGSTTSGSPLTDVFNTVGGLFSGGSASSSGASAESSSNFPGILGNILLDQNGATIFSQTVNSANNSETSGFYGSDTTSGQPQGVVSSMCQSRPWASNFLANIIPPSFFDSLCQWGGFQVGQTQTVAPAQTQTQPQVTLTQQTASAPTITTQTATATTPAVAAQAVIWAVPASVPLGTRTSVFWNTQGVTQCTETSPDGSFNESSLSGAAATVPLTQATVYTISCLDPNGNPITNYVTVTISS